MKISSSLVTVLLLLLFFMIVSPSKHGKWAATMSMVFGDEKVESVTSCRASTVDLYRCFRQMMKNFLGQFFFPCVLRVRSTIDVVFLDFIRLLIVIRFGCFFFIWFGFFYWIEYLMCSHVNICACDMRQRLDTLISRLSYQFISFSRSGMEWILALRKTVTFFMPRDRIEQRTDNRLQITNHTNISYLWLKKNL